MVDQYFGHKELYEVVLRAKTPMDFGNRYIEAEEPVLYFTNVNMSTLSESNRPTFARGGWGNMPRVIWDDRTEVQFQMVEGIMSSVGMSILLSANVAAKQEDQPLYIHKKELLTAKAKLNKQTGEIEYVYIDTQYRPVDTNIRKTFIFEYEHKAIQQKIYGQRLDGIVDGFQNPVQRIKLYLDKECTINAKNSIDYMIDYYYEYGGEALIYSVNKERFNGLFTLEAKFYSKDENEGRNYTNILYMPKVRIVSNINLRLGERADPTVSTFNIIGMPETVGEQKNLIMEITRLDTDIDEII